MPLRMQLFPPRNAPAHLIVSPSSLFQFDRWASLASLAKVKSENFISIDTMYTAHMCVCVCVRKCSFNPTDEWRTPIRLSYATGVSIGRNTQMADLCRAAETWLPTGSQQTRDRKGKIDKRSSGKRLQTVRNMMDERIFWLNVASLFLYLFLQISFSPIFLFPQSTSLFY